MKENIQQILRDGRSENAHEEERQKMLSLFHQSEVEYDLKEQLFEELENMPEKGTSIPNTKKMFFNLWSVIEHLEERKNFKTRYFTVWIRVAAALVVGLVTGVLLTILANNEDPLYYTAHSPMGSVSEWVLPDNTVIFLNSGSRIRYTMEGNEQVREVFLEGEAWFDVEKDKKRPFLVHTPLYDVFVTGTKFNVKAYPSENKVITTLEEGEILLKSAGQAKLEEEIRLNPGEQAVLGREIKHLSIQKVETRYYTSWKDNKLIFMNMNLKELLVLLERKFGVDIEVKDPSILDYHCDGTFKNESILDVMQIIQRTLPIEYEIVGQKIIVTSTKN